MMGRDQRRQATSVPVKSLLLVLVQTPFPIVVSPLGVNDADDVAA
jgi:hypothetical protein